MYSLRLALSILCVYSTVNTSYAGGDRMGKIEYNRDIAIYFVVTPGTTITTSGEIKVPVDEAKYEETGQFYAVKHLVFTKITDAPVKLEFPFTHDPESKDYSYITIDCVLTATEVESPYHWDFTFKLVTGFLVDSQNSKKEYEIFATNSLSETVAIFGSGNLVLQVGTRWLLTDQDKQEVRVVTIGNTSIWYLGPDDPAGTPFTLIDL